MVGNISIQLTKGEIANNSFGIPPTTTLDWFKGDHDSAVKTLASRIDQILSANPWLSGRYESKAHFDYSTDKRFFDVADILQHRNGEDFLDRTTTTYKELVALVQNPGNSLALVHKEYRKQPFWKVSVVTDKDQKHFALFVSLAHGIGDGFTFYSLYNMLVGSSPVRPMIPERPNTTMEQQEVLMGKIEANLSSMPGVAVNLVYNYLKTQVHKWLDSSSEERHMRFFLVDESKIKSMKEEHAQSCKTDGVDFISANDIITSWVLSQSDCAFGGMAVNLRGRLEGHTDSHSFNAENDLFYRKADVCTPALIRHSIQSMKRSVTAQEPFSNWNFLQGGGIGYCTNWAGFKKDGFDLKDSEHVVHLPLYDIDQLLFSAENVAAIIFKPRRGQLAVALAYGHKKADQMSSKAPFESDQKFDTFPVGPAASGLK